MKNKMPLYKYNIGYWTAEESEYTQFFFNKKLTKKQLADYVNKATANALRYAVNHEDEFSFGPRGRGQTFQDLYPKVVEELKKVGFKPIRYDGVWSCFGWGSVCISDWESYSCLENKLLRKFIPKDLKQKAINISKKKEEKIQKEMKKRERKIKSEDS